jgi:subtilisin family serine protease
VEQQRNATGSGRPERPVKGKLRTEPALAVAPEAWDKHRARRLDPVKALLLRGQTPPRPTLYAGETVLLRGLLADDSALRILQNTATDLALRIVDDGQVDADRELLNGSGLPDNVKEELREIWVSVLHFEPDTDEPALPPDAWAILQNLRARRGEVPSGQIAKVALEHLVSSSGPGIGGNPFTNPHGMGGNPFTNPHGGDELNGYGMAGLGGRQPVNWVGQPPTNRYAADQTVRRPLVALLDCGVVDHPWLDSNHVERNPEVLGQQLGLPVEPSDLTGMSDALIGDLQAEAGHGTFIAGLIRQACPDAKILSVKVFGGDGVVAEGQLLRSLQLLALRQALAVNGDTSVDPVDVVSMSLGYYHEQPEDAAFDALLLGPIAMLGALGATVVVSAGNDATVRPMYPAAFTPHKNGLVQAAREALPVIAVGATNPNTSVALFSNEGPWVRARRPGAALVSSYPQTFDASGQPVAELITPAGEWRSTLDPDDYSAGFAVWSGTSFAAPVLAGQIAAQLLELDIDGVRAGGVKAAVALGWLAIAKATVQDPDPLVRP